MEKEITIKLNKSDWLFILSSLATVASLVSGDSEVKADEIYKEVKQQVFDQV